VGGGGPLMELTNFYYQQYVDIQAGPSPLPDIAWPNIMSFP